MVKLYVDWFFTGVLGVLFLGEKFTSHEAVGFIIIVAGLCLQTAHDLGWIGKPKNDA